MGLLTHKFGDLRIPNAHHPCRAAFDRTRRNRGRLAALLLVGGGQAPELTVGLTTLNSYRSRRSVFAIAGSSQRFIHRRCPEFRAPPGRTEVPTEHAPRVEH